MITIAIRTSKAQLAKIPFAYPSSFCHKAAAEAVILEELVTDMKCASNLSANQTIMLIAEEGTSSRYAFYGFCRSFQREVEAKLSLYTATSF